MSSSAGCPSIEPADLSNAEQQADCTDRDGSRSVEESTLVNSSVNDDYSMKVNEEETTMKSSSFWSSIDYSTDGDTSSMRTTRPSLMKEDLKLFSYQRQFLRSTPTSHEANRVIDEAFHFCALDDSLPVSPSMVQAVVTGVKEQQESPPITVDRLGIAQPVKTYRSSQRQSRLSDIRSSKNGRDYFAPIASSSPITLSRQQRDLANWQRSITPAFEPRLSELQKEIDLLRHYSDQWTVELEHCRKKFTHRDNQPEINALRALLITNERRLALKHEVEQLKKEMQGENQPILTEQVPRGTLIIKQISVKLTRKFANEDKNDSYYLIGLIKYRDKVLSTSIAHQIQLTSVDCVNFFDQIELNNLPPDFAIAVEVHALRLSVIDEKTERSSSRLSKGSSIRNKAVLLFSPRKMHLTLSTTKTTMESVKFERVGFLRLTHAMVVGGERSFYLDDNRFPLEGSVRFDLRCCAARNISHMQHHGFLGDWYAKATVIGGA
uniref:Anillin homology domain-containing protein n=1 Tax=Plectus sambesii TaxID=2011161 RepID=A0A914W111_9BILA